MSLPSRGAWIEIASVTWMTSLALCRSPHGERGLKFIAMVMLHDGVSRSPHGERGLKWCRPAPKREHQRRSPHGERGLKLLSLSASDGGLGRSPHGERGLKSEPLKEQVQPVARSLPSRGAWIEIAPPSYPGTGN